MAAGRELEDIGSLPKNHDLFQNPDYPDRSMSLNSDHGDSLDYLQSFNERNSHLTFQRPPEDSDDEPLLDLDEAGPSCNHTGPCSCPITVGTTRRPRFRDKKARNQLLICCVLSFLFMIGEFTGGYLANSLAIMTDAAHMFSDFGSFLISLAALWIGSRQPTNKMTFGYYRAEVLGALVSVLIIWLLTGILVFEAVQRIIHKSAPIEGDTMLITAGCSVAFNILLTIVLHFQGRSHGHSHGLSHGHSHGGTSRVHEGESDGRNINVRAAFIHVIGDLLQSVGVLIAAYIIRYKPEYQIADPICTFLFSGLVLVTTVTILRDTIRVLLEATPRSIDVCAVKRDLAILPGVRGVHNLHVWSLTMDKNVLNVHLVLAQDADHEVVLESATWRIRKNYPIQHCAIQVEKCCTPCIQETKGAAEG
ncbi:SLC30A3 [Branchiostoma lanceolatum]|uniref:SLC30A3 protein n=1 Tax=Branchiostoma lanceolatum TaxID=7740 RepID=A0A8J9YT43_BRALA|nr:SLC30A3 [Branchiostoma lanceolatum]